MSLYILYFWNLTSESVQMLCGKTATGHVGVPTECCETGKGILIPFMFNGLYGDSFVIFYF